MKIVSIHIFGPSSKDLFGMQKLIEKYIEHLFSDPNYQVLTSN